MVKQHLNKFKTFAEVSCFLVRALRYCCCCSTKDNVVWSQRLWVIGIIGRVSQWSTIDEALDFCENCRHFVPGKGVRTHDCFQGSFRLLDKTLIYSALVWTEGCGEDPAKFCGEQKILQFDFFLLVLASSAPSRFRQMTCHCPRSSCVANHDGLQNAAGHAWMIELTNLPQFPGEWREQ